MASGYISSLKDGCVNDIPVESQGERLANVDVVERFHQVVHGDVLNRKLGDLDELFALFSLLEVLGRNIIRRIELIGLVHLVLGLGRLIEDELQLRQLGLLAIVLGVRYENDILVVIPALQDKGTIGALPAVISQVVGKFQAILVDELLLNHPGGLMG